MNSYFGIDSEDAMEVFEEFYPMELGDDGNDQQGEYQNGLVTNNVTSIEQGLRQSVTAVS
ncbi:hypothetical protein [Psychrobacter sp. Ps7]|uniref:hypothetical protein n=1 Tax=Psychrobacter sp. Ps7 TaxID=2790961 RepID=UPI001EDDBC2A|nr:hypothetical protein [Psychrobacter sp. Ps7]MCG3873561.1 hypothetical protein [Psychrobacter sp. Ps7]